MRQLLLALALLVPASMSAQTFFAYNGQCAKGGQAVLTQNKKSQGTTPIPPGGPTTTTSGVLASYPSCTVTVFLTGTTTPATLFSNPTPTPLANPFTANTDGSFIFFAAAGGYDVTLTGAGIPTPVTLTDIQLGASGGGGGGGSGTVEPGNVNLVPRYVGPGVQPTVGPGTMTDDTINPVASPNGFNVVTNGGYDYQVLNNTGTGTVNQTTACNDGTQAAIICPHATSTTNHSIGFVVSGGGNTGLATLCNLGWCSVLLDNQSTAGHYAIQSPTVDGELTDSGTACTGGQENFLVFSANTGPGTASIIRMLNANEPCVNGGGFINPMTTLGDMIDGGNLGVATRLGGPTTPASVPQTLISVPFGGLATTPAWSPLGIPTNPQTGTTYTIQATDRATFLSFSNGSPIAVTLPQAGTAGFDKNFVFEACSIGAGTTTITPTTSTISYTTGTAYVAGASSIPLTTGHCAIVRSDNVNYFATSNTASSGGSVSSFSAGTLSPLFTTSVATPTTTPALTFALTNAGANSIFGNFTGSSGAPSYNTISACGDGSHALAWTSGTGFTCQAISVGTGTVTTTGSPANGNLTQFSGSTSITNGNLSGDVTTTNTLATTLAAAYKKKQCTEVWGGSGTSFAMQSGDDAIARNRCYNDSGVTWTITAVKCNSDNAGNTTTVNPTFGSDGTGTTILSGALTCGNSYVMSASGTVSNASWTTGAGIAPGMATVGNATSIGLLIEYTIP